MSGLEGLIRYTDIRNLPAILKEPEAISEINKVPEAIHNPYICSTSFPGPGSLFIQTTLIVPYVEVIGFGLKKECRISSYFVIMKVL